MKKLQYSDFFNKNEMVFYDEPMIYQKKYGEASNDEKLRKTIGKNGKDKYMKYFNSDLVAGFIINRTLGLKDTKKYLWHN